MISFKPEPFYNRSTQLAALDRAWKRHGKGGQMMLLYGRRRLGKTYLLQYYFAGGVSHSEQRHKYCYYLAEQSTATAQRATLARQLLASFPAQRTTVEEIAVSWNALLSYFSQQSRNQEQINGRYTLILDEFPYAVEQTPELPSIVQSWWDQDGVHAPIFLILCGSQLSAMASLGTESAPLFGRFNAGIQLLEALKYYDVAEFYADSASYGVIETLIMYGAFGGTPRYHALVDTSRTMSEEIVELLMQPNAVLENEVRFLLGSEQIRDAAPYNAVLGAIASGETSFGKINDLTGLDGNRLSFYLRTLQELGWVRRELPFSEKSERRALYLVADPFLTFWYRVISPLTSELRFTDPRLVYAERVAPVLSQYMGFHVFEEICSQWLQKNARVRHSLSIRSMGRYWSRDGQTEIDIIAELDTGTFLFGECKWSATKAVGLKEYSKLLAKVGSLPYEQWKVNPTYILFSVAGFESELQNFAENATDKLILVTGLDLLERDAISA